MALDMNELRQALGAISAEDDAVKGHRKAFDDEFGAMFGGNQQIGDILYDTLADKTNTGSRVDKLKVEEALAQFDNDVTTYLESRAKAQDSAQLLKRIQDMIAAVTADAPPEVTNPAMTDTPTPDQIPMPIDTPPPELAGMTPVPPPDTGAMPPDVPPPAPDTSAPPPEAPPTGEMPPPSDVPPPQTVPSDKRLKIVKKTAVPVVPTKPVWKPSGSMIKTIVGGI